MLNVTHLCARPEFQFMPFFTKQVQEKNKGKALEEVVKKHNRRVHAKRVCF